MRLNVAFLSLLLIMVTLGAAYDPCCSYPCQNGGICVNEGSAAKFSCDCTSLEYYGTTCQTPTWWKWVKSLAKPDPMTIQHLLTNYDWLWSTVNAIPFLQRKLMKYIYITRGGMVDTPSRYTSAHEYITLEAHFNASYYARTLPPVPKDCPTPMGVEGKATLPEVDLVAEKLFRRGKFKPEPNRSNLLFSFYAQHFTHQFFKTDYSKGPGYTWGSEGVDASHIYGKDTAAQNELRLFQDGKMKTSTVNGEQFPPLVSEAPGIQMPYHPGVPHERRFALGQPFFALLPGLFTYSTVWLREHNRVCEVLKQDHPDWDDERLYQTARLIIVGENVKITIEDYVQHLSQYKLRVTFDPQLTHGTAHQFSNRIRAEFNHLYHWHPLFPDTVNVSGHVYSLAEMAYNVEPVFKHGFNTFIEALVSTEAGELTHHNHGDFLMPVLRSALQHGRQLRFQPFNQYRKRFNMKPYKTMQELTGDEKMAAELTEMYGSVDAVEFFVGLMVEKKAKSVTPPSMVEIGGPYSVKGLLSNPICSQHYWKPSTFGGQRGFDIVKSASIRKLFCDNLKPPCPKIAFTVPQDEEEDVRSEL